MILAGWLLLGTSFCLAAEPGVGGVRTSVRAPVPGTIPKAVVLQKIVVTPQTPGLYRMLRSRLEGLGIKALSYEAASPLLQLLAEHFPEASLTYSQGNPLQPTLRVNGFAASPLLGLPEGISVYVDGVRVNEPFGDVVNWDLIPRTALRSVLLVPGANPIFGLNTLGGALAMMTRSGFDSPGGMVRVLGGSYGRHSLAAREGGHRWPFAWFFSAETLHQNGWQAFSPTDNRTAFGKFSWRQPFGRFDASYTFAQSSLYGGQTLPLTWLSDIHGIYTSPDYFDNLLHFVNLREQVDLSPSWRLLLRGYVRRSDQTGLDSNVNNDYPGGPPSLHDPEGSNTLDYIGQRSRGVVAQASYLGQTWGLESNAVFGVSINSQAVHFTQANQAATFLPSRWTLGITPFNEQPVALDVANMHRSVYFMERITPLSRLAVDIAGRYDQAEISLHDLIGTALTGRHLYTRLNPAIGVRGEPARHLWLYLRYAEAMRTPTPVELECADPNAPCTLPNALVSDPALEPVIARTVEAGGRWRVAGIRISVDYTRAMLNHTIEFVSRTNQTQGFFVNVPHTLHRSWMLSASGGNRIFWSVGLSHVLATYDSGFEEPSPYNSSADAAGNIRIQSGDRIPNIPAWRARLVLGMRPIPALRMAAVLLAYSDRYAQGDNNNRDLVGAVPGYAIVSLNVTYNWTAHWRFGLAVHNLFNRRYATYGTLGVNQFTAPRRQFNIDPNAWRVTQFRAPGAPFGFWISMQYHW